MVKSLPVRSIVDAIDAAATAWRNPALEARQRARSAVSERMEYSLPVVDYAFDRLFRSITADGLCSVIAAELGCLDVLDRFVEREPGLSARALAIGRVCIVSSRTTIGVAILPAIFALCAKCDVLVKDREDRLVGAFLATLGAASPQLGGAAAAVPWRSERDRGRPRGVRLRGRLRSRRDAKRHLEHAARSHALHRVSGKSQRGIPGEGGAAARERRRRARARCRARHAALRWRRLP